MDKAVEAQVRARAQERCEYCGLLQKFSPLNFQLDHIIAKQHGGTDTASNLAIACMFCNSHKGPNLTGIDGITGSITRLFHPRNDLWPAHFRVRGNHIEGLTDIGRATIAVLSMNHRIQIGLRQAMANEAGLT